MTKVRVALIGLGGWGGSAILPAIEEAGNLELVTWFDTNPDTVAAYRNRISVEPASSYEEVLNRQDVDGVLLVVPNHLHAPLAIQAASHGKHIWVEKPIANHVAEANAMIEASEKSGVILSVGHSLRRHGVIRKAKKLVSEGKIGDLVAIEGHQSHRGGWSLTPSMWRSYEDKCPGGPMNLLGIHQIDTMHYIMGPSAEVTSIMTKKYLNYEAVEITALIIRFKNNLIGTITSTYISPAKTFLSIYGTTGWLECDLTRGKLTYYDIESIPEDIEVETPNPIAEEFREFGECILSGKRPETGGPEARAAVAVLEAAVESAKTGKTIRLDPGVSNL